jgi:hypothetical protein
MADERDGFAASDGSWRAGAPLSRRRLLRGTGTLAAGVTLWPGLLAAATANRPSVTANLPAPGRQPGLGAVPALDDLAGGWMPAGTLLNMPSAGNFSGSLHAGWNLLSFLELTLPPLSLSGECAVVFLDGVNVQAHHARWYPYQVLREATVGDVSLRSTVRMGFEQPLVLIELDITNNGSSSLRADLDVRLGGYLRSYPGTWQWTVPRQYGDFSAWSGQLADSGRLLLVSDGESPAVTAFAFPDAPDTLSVEGDSGSAGWRLALLPGQRRTIRLVVAAGTGADTVTKSAVSARTSFQALFTQAKTAWERRFADAFTPGNQHFSGSLPVLVTADKPLADLYYRGVVSLLALERTSYPQYFPRVYTTAGPQWGVTLSYFWDTSLFSPLLALLDPVMVREQVSRWLELGIYNGYAMDALSGQLVGPWYSANDLSVFTLLLDYVSFTGDTGFLDEQAGSKTVIEHMQDIALHWQQLEVAATRLADYGGESNLLEEVPDYVNQVPSLNAANVCCVSLAARRPPRTSSFSWPGTWPAGC